MVNLNRTVADVIDTNIPHWAALTAVTTDAENGAYAPGVTTGTLTVTLHEDEDVRSWLTQAGATDPNDKLEGAYAEYSRSTVLGASMDGGKTIIPLYIAPGGSQMVGKLEFPVSTEDDVTHVVEFFELQDGNPITSGEGEDAKPVPFFGIYTSFVAQQAVILGEGDVTFTTPADWPKEEGQRVFGDQLTAPFTLSFTVVDQSATWKDTSKVTIRDSEGKLVDEDAHFLWESSNPQVATINEKGEITILTNGAVSFTLTALNGNVEKTPADPPQEATTYAYTYATPEILVGVGNSPFLTVPGSLRTTTVRGGQPATVLWSSNLTEKNRDNAAGVEDLDSVETIFTLTLYKAGDFDESAGKPNEDAQGVALDPVVSSMKDVKSSALIPADKIPYANGEPYYVTISATDNATGKTYTSWAKIEVQSPPAVVELARPSSLYITDEVDTLPLTWSLANFNGDGKEFRLVITNNTTSAVQGTDVNAGNQSGSFTMNIADVTNGYRDTYTVEVAAKNATDSTWSYDSFVLYVYDRAALQQLVVDGKDTANGSAITLSNGEKEYIQGLIDSQNSTAAQQAVWDTGRDISLTADVSMDPDKPWLEVPDQFAWSAEDTTAASGTGQTHVTLNYQQGALYEDITRYQRTSYGPAAEFRLSGLSDGTTKVTAEHVNTGTVAELIVNVDTLQDKLFLFQFTPAVETTLRYTNGDGVQKEVTSMADGRAAIYEESGIQGDVYLESQQGDTEYFGTLYNENLVSSEKDSTQLELYPVNYMTLRKAAQVPIYLKKPDGTPYLGEVTVHGSVYLNDAYSPDARLDTDDGRGYDGKEGYTVNLAQDNGAHTFVFDMTQFSTEGRDVGTDPVDASDNLQFVFQMEAEGYYPLLVRVNGNINEEDAIATGERIITLEEAPVDSETNEVVKEPFAAVQTLYYGENKYGYSDDVKGRKGKLGPGDTYSDLELETLTLWWGQEKSESGMSLRFEDQFGIIPKNQNCQILNYPFTTMPVTIHSWQLNKDTMSGWLDTLEGAGLNMVYTDSQGQQVKREDPGFRIINMLGAGDAADEDTMLRLMRETALKSTSNGEGRIDVANALVSTGIALATTYNIGTDMDMLTMKIVPTADPTVFRGIFLAGINNMIDDNFTSIDPDTSQKDDLDYMPGFADLKNIASMGASGWATDAKNRTENAQKLLKNHATTRNRENNISYMLKGGFETEIYYDYNAGAWKMVVVTGQLNVGGGFGMSWNFNSFCGPVSVTAQLAFGVALDVQFAAAVDRTQMANDYLTQVQLNAFIRAFGGIGFDYAILAMKIGLFGQLSFQGAVRFLNAIGEAQAKVGYKIDFLGEVGIEFLIKFLFITYERVLWSQKIQIPSIQDNNWDAIDAYWEEVQQGNSGNEYEIITPGETQQASLTASQQPELLAADSSTGVALYGAPSTATLESRDYLESPRTYGGSLQVLRARAQTLAENTTSTGLIQLDGEGVATVQPITFKQKGAGVAYRFGESQTEASTGLTEIALSQIPLRMEDGIEAEGTTTFQVTAGASLTETTLTVLQEYLPATVTVNGKPYDVNDIASRTFSLPVGTTTLDIVVTSGDKTHTYRVEITRPSTGGGTGGGGSTRYPITVPEEDHGTVSVSPSRASSGQTVTITVTPDEGYKVGSVTVKRPNGSTVPVTGQGNGKYTFTMPSGGIAVDVTFIPEDWPFVDVTEDKWYYDAVAYVYQQGIMVGMSETTFEPNTTVNRAQVVQMLYNLEGQPQVSGDSGFSDIRDDQWHAKAVAWASANDVVAGYEDGTFRPTRAVTREEFAQILYNYAKCKGYGLSASADLGKFPDSGQVSSWAETALGWANGNGLINGHGDGRLDPKGSTIRAQAASILMNFDKGFAQEG